MVLPTKVNCIQQATNLNKS